MELYLLISFIGGLACGMAVFYLGYRLGIRANYRIYQQMPVFEDETEGFDQDVTD